MSNRRLVILLCILVLGWLAVSTVRLAVRALTAEGPLGFGLISEVCPKCGHPVVLSPGKETPCESCGERLAACESCGETLHGPDIADHDPKTPWLCHEHRIEADWVSTRLREFATKEALTPPPDTPRAVACRRHYERRVREVFSQKKYPGEELFSFANRRRLDAKGDAGENWPKAVVEAYQFYDKALMSRDIGTVGIFPWDFEGSPLYLVHCDTDGSNGYLEMFDADGSPLGYARTDWECPAWTSRGAVRRRAFVGDRDAVDRQVAEALKRLRGESR